MELNQFRTTFDIPDTELDIQYGQPIFSIGSCFAEHMADRLQHYGFDVLSNPNGILFNPVSLALNLRNLTEKRYPTKSELITHNGLWNSWQHHHSCSDTDPDRMIQKLQATGELAAEHLSNSKMLLVTFGTAFAYMYKASGALVANCHKIPNDRFEKVRLSQHRIVGEWQDTLTLLLAKNPDLKVIMTVSPVRHIKDGVVANQRSKATLLLAIEALTMQFEHVHYFPSYEIMMDDLRDYRFYKSDMLHPNDEAVKYIWHRFTASFMSSETLGIMKEVNRLQAQRNHRLMHPTTDQAKSFVASTKEQWNALLKRYPLLKLE